MLCWNTFVYHPIYSVIQCAILFLLLLVISFSFNLVSEQVVFLSSYCGSIIENTVKWSKSNNLLKPLYNPRQQKWCKCSSVVPFFSPSQLRSFYMVSTVIFNSVDADCFMKVRYKHRFYAELIFWKHWSIDYMCRNYFNSELRTGQS